MKTTKSSKREVKKTEKYKLENFSKLFLQIGLVVTLLIILIIFESKTEIYSPNKTSDNTVASYETYDLIDFVVPEEPKPTKPEPKTKATPKFTPKNFKVVDKKIIDFIEDPLKKETKIDDPNTLKNAYVKPKKEIIPIATTTWSKIEKAPMYPGCEGYKTEKAKRKCLQEKITKHIGRYFNSDLANELNLNSGKNRIMVQFKIDQNGNIIDIIAAAPHHKLKKEAIRIIDKLPKMTPGTQRNKPVIVKYALPINFMVE